MNKKILIMFGIFSLFLVGCGTKTTNLVGPQEEVVKEKILTYKNKEYRLILDFPGTRTFKENVFGTNVMFFAPKKENQETNEYLGITIYLIQSGTDLQSLYQDNREIIQSKSKDFVVENEKDIKIDKFPAKEIEYSFSQDNYDIKILQILVLKEELAYVINYTSTKETFNNHKKDVDKIIKSISIR